MTRPPTTYEEFDAQSRERIPCCPGSCGWQRQAGPLVWKTLGRRPWHWVPCAVCNPAGSLKPKPEEEK